MVYLVNKKRVIYFPPPKDEKVIVLDLTKFKSPPKPIIEPKILPKQLVVKKKRKKKKHIVKRKARIKKRFVKAQKSTQDNNETKNSLKTNSMEIKRKIAKLKEKKRLTKIKEDRKRKKDIEKKRKRIAELKKMERDLEIKEAKVRIAKRNQERIRKRKYQSSLANSLMSGGVSTSYNQRGMRTLNNNSSTRLINKLYGHEFDSYSSDQKKFLRNNLGRIHAITQRALSRNGYPESAIRMGQEGVNVVSFYLHPNGNITNLKLDRSMGHSSLDNNTLQVIRIAYSNYPLPKVRTKIKFYVNYTID